MRARARVCMDVRACVRARVRSIVVYVHACCEEKYFEALILQALCKLQIHNVLHRLLQLEINTSVSIHYTRRVRECVRARVRRNSRTDACVCVSECVGVSVCVRACVHAFVHALMSVSCTYVSVC